MRGEMTHVTSESGETAENSTMRFHTQIAVIAASVFFSIGAFAQVAPPPPRPAPPSAQQNTPVPAAPVTPAIDPGVRSGADAGGPLSNLSGEELKFFAAAFEVFK